jgi:hypothetical protein
MKHDDTCTIHVQTCIHLIKGGCNKDSADDKNDSGENDDDNWDENKKTSMT